VFCRVVGERGFTVHGSCELREDSPAATEATCIGKARASASRILRSSEPPLNGLDSGALPECPGTHYRRSAELKKRHSVRPTLAACLGCPLVRWSRTRSYRVTGGLVCAGHDLLHRLVVLSGAAYVGPALVSIRHGCHLARRCLSSWSFQPWLHEDPGHIDRSPGMRCCVSSPATSLLPQCAVLHGLSVVSVSYLFLRRLCIRCVCFPLLFIFLHHFLEPYFIFLLTWTELNILHSRALHGISTSFFFLPFLCVTRCTSFLGEFRQYDVESFARAPHFFLLVPPFSLLPT